MRFEKQEFDGETIVLDDNEYIDCTFRNCRFQYDGGEFNIERIRFDTIEFTVSGAAARTVVLLRSLWAGPAGRQAVLALLDPAVGAADRPQ
ncbi:MAG: hypothetical protein AB7G76_05955 [Steroidobacteraceae bacterium]